MSTVTLRAPEPDDLDRLYRWENDPQQWHNSLTPPLTSRHALWQYIAQYTADLSVAGSVRMLIVTNDGTAVGTADICDYDPRNATAFVSIYVAGQYRGKRYGTEALRLIVRLAAEAYGLKGLAALIASGNEPSRHIFANAGFAQCGTLPGWIKRPESRDLQIFALTLQ